MIDNKLCAKCGYETMVTIVSVIRFIWKLIFNFIIYNLFNLITNDDNIAMIAMLLSGINTFYELSIMSIACFFKNNKLKIMSYSILIINSILIVIISSSSLISSEQIYKYSNTTIYNNIYYSSMITFIIESFCAMLVIFPICSNLKIIESFIQNDYVIQGEEL